MVTFLLFLIALPVIVAIISHLILGVIYVFYRWWPQMIFSGSCVLIANAVLVHG